MKIFAILILLFATVLPAQTLGDYDAAYPGLDFALHSTFIRCYVHHWKGTQTSIIERSSNEVKLTCDGFWGKFVEAKENPIVADQLSSPFEIIEHGTTPPEILEIPFHVWNGYLWDIIDASDDNPLRKSE